MPAPLSTDLRWRIARAYERGEGSRADLAQRFAVGKASVDRVIRQARQSGSLEPKKPGGSRRLLTEADEALVRSWIEAQPDLTQDELAQRFTEHTGRRVSRRTMGRVRARLGLTRKKDDAGRAATAPRRRSRAGRLPRLARYGRCDQDQSR